MSYIVVIPARHGSTRLPGKTAARYCRQADGAARMGNKRVRVPPAKWLLPPMISRIVDVAQGFGARVCMTATDHPSGTDRLQEVAAQLGWADEQIVVNVQGDEPMIPPAVIDQVAANLAEKTTAGIATLCESIDALPELLDSNAVKVVFDTNGMALYFSRATIPWPREQFKSGQQLMPAEGRWYRHIGIYAYRTAFLHEYVTWRPAPPEQLEQLEQLRGTV